MIHRKLLENLREWARRANRKPLVIRGARQVGKTTLVKEFGREFDTFFTLNLERRADREIFANADTPQKVMEVLRLTRVKKAEVTGGRTLLFIDEIQAEPKAIAMLRYFYEEMPQIFIIAAGSRLQELFKSGVSFPVGRVEFMSMRPCFFEEYLDGTGHEALAQMVGESGAIEAHVHAELDQLFQTYALVGGMPEIIDRYAEEGDVSTLAPLYRGLLQSYDEDVEKYAATATQTGVLRHLLRNGWSFAGQTISFARFGGSNYTSAAVHQAFELLERAFLVSLDYPITGVKAPALSALTRSPKLVWLDSGLVNFSAQIQVEYLSNRSLNDVWRGHAAEQIVGQEVWEVLDRNYIGTQNFWIRDKRGSDAEVDFVLPYKGLIIPIEVKSGPNAHLRSLQSFMGQEGAGGVAVRVWNKPFSVDVLPNFRLLNVPFYLVGQLDRLLERYL